MESLVYMLVIFTAAFVADQGTKHLVARHLDEGQALGDGWLRIRRITNRHGWLVLTRRRSLLLLLWCVTAIGVVLLGTLASRGRPTALPLYLGLALGGATANAWDWLWRRGVLDFIDLRVWPVFNLADVAIVAGVAGAVWCLR